MDKITNKNMFDIIFPKTPENEEFICDIYVPKSSNLMYKRITKKDAMLMEYYWDGISYSFNGVIINRICNK